MTTILNTLRVHTDRWDDPGDYPSGAGSGPLPSYYYIDSIEGIVTIHLEEQDLPWFEGDFSPGKLAEYVNEIVGVDAELAEVVVGKWQVEKWNPARREFTLSVEEFDDISGGRFACSYDEDCA